MAPASSLGPPAVDPAFSFECDAGLPALSALAARLGGGSAAAAENQRLQRWACLLRMWRCLHGWYRSSRHRGGRLCLRAAGAVLAVGAAKATPSLPLPAAASPPGGGQPWSPWVPGKPLCVARAVQPPLPGLPASCRGPFGSGGQLPPRPPPAPARRELRDACQQRGRLEARLLQLLQAQQAQGGGAASGRTRGQRGEAQLLARERLADQQVGAAAEGPPGRGLPLTVGARADCVAHQPSSAGGLRAKLGGGGGWGTVSAGPPPLCAAAARSLHCGRCRAGAASPALLWAHHTRPAAALPAGHASSPLLPRCLQAVLAVSRCCTACRHSSPPLLAALPAGCAGGRGKPAQGGAAAAGG